MGFLTKIDISDNRQAKQRIETSTHFSGATVHGVTFDMLPTGVNELTSGETSSTAGVYSSFSGNSGTTIFTWGISSMSLATNFSAITPTNTGTTQYSGEIFVPNLTGTSIDGYPIVISYSGVSFDIEPTYFIDLGGGNYSGSVITNEFLTLSANSIDFTGSTIWLDTSGITRTNQLMVTDNPVVGYVLTCENNNGLVSFQPASGGTSFWSASSGTNAIVVKHSESLASGLNSLSEGYRTTASGSYSHTEGLSTIASGVYSHAEGSETTATSNGSHAEGYQTRATTRYAHAEGNLTWAAGEGSHAEGYATSALGAYSHAQGQSTTASGSSSHASGLQSLAAADYSFVHGTGSTAYGIGTIVLGNNITGTTDNTTYVEKLNIKTVGIGPGVTDIGVDVNGNVVNQASDLRLKKNISTIEGALDKVKRLRGVKYQWQDELNGGSDYRLGFIAQEVNEVEPLLSFVNQTTDNYMGVLYKDVPALLVEAIKELVSDEVIINKKYLETQKIIAEDNNIDLNCNGDSETAIGGGISVLYGLNDGSAAELKIDNEGNWVTNTGFKPQKITIPNYTPNSSKDTYGDIGDITVDDDYMYIKNKNGWVRVTLNTF